MRYVPTILAGLAVGTLLGVATHCAYAWYQGGSPDPRCVYGLRGYVEVHVLDSRERVSCEYRPEVGAP